MQISLAGVGSRDAHVSLCVPLSPGSAGTYKLDSHGDRDVELSVIYTTTDHKVLSLTDCSFEPAGGIRATRVFFVLSISFYSALTPSPT